MGQGRHTLRSISDAVYLRRTEVPQRGPGALGQVQGAGAEPDILYPRTLTAELREGATPFRTNTQPGLWGGSAPALGPKPWSSSTVTFQP